MKTLDPSYFQIFCGRCEGDQPCSTVEAARERHNPELPNALDGRVYDMFGRQLHPGDAILYGYNVSRSAAIKVGKILKIDFPDPGQPLHRAANRLHRIRVAGITREFLNFQDRYQTSLKVGHPGTLLFPGDIIRIEADILPPAYRDVFDQVHL